MFGRKKDVYEADDSPFYKQRSWIFSAVFLATALVVATLSYATSSGGDTADAAPQRKTMKGPLSTHDSKRGGLADDERPKGCQTEDEDAKNTENTENTQNTQNGQDPENGADTRRPTAAPKDVAWKSLNGASVPTSPSAGPTRYNGPVWWCFARTPMGSVMAAHSILTHMGTAQWRPVAEQQLVNGEGRDTFIAGRSKLAASDVENQDPGVYSGFTVDSFSKNAANVRILIKGAGGGLGSTTVSMRWSGGDWKVKPRPNGTLFSSSSGMGANGFIRWGAA
ncbi:MULTISPECIES: hypothetical protein [unclassified Streptomyces]|uniref:hypothetical protein n=1 Tax=unclassified Streptomyces TaxID=2593676 RepID=UPI002DDA27FF|nr:MULTISPECIES: hypothetical protein [unclassified Streptomyces]WSA91380.1 hypothetical protein OIE63_07280 [Streptomyces sp. NBC_01795]WSS16012.1 hypothetical protein OG533_32085 [Streptomyces sp. NBC_01186]WSS44830.1 hypothetical protein OG220_32765 [Streptomyces sp. NBC_01187]